MTGLIYHSYALISSQAKDIETERRMTIAETKLKELEITVCLLDAQLKEEVDRNIQLMKEIEQSELINRKDNE